MAISLFGQSTSQSTTVTLPAGIANGDLIIIYSYRGTTGAPTTPTGYTAISTQSANSNAHKVSYKWAVGNEGGTTVTAGTSVNMNAMVFRGVGGIGNAAGRTNAASTSITIPALTPNLTDGTSWIVIGAGSRQATSQTIPSGMTQIGTNNTNTSGLVTTNVAYQSGITGSFALTTETIASSQTSASWTLELVASKLDNSSSIVSTINQTAGGTTSGSFTVGSGSNRVLIIGVATWNNGGTGTGLSSLTYNGVAMSLVQTGLANGAFYTEQWKLVAPASGSNTIVATVAGKTDKLGLGITSWTGIDQTTPVDVSGNTSGTAAAVTLSLTTTNANEWLVDTMSHLSANVASSRTGILVYEDATSGVDTTAQWGYAGTAGANSLSYTMPDPGDGWSYSVLALKPGSGGGPPPTATNLFFFGS